MTKTEFISWLQERYAWFDRAEHSQDGAPDQTAALMAKQAKLCYSVVLSKIGKLDDLS